VAALKNTSVTRRVSALSLRVIFHPAQDQWSAYRPAFCDYLEPSLEHLGQLGPPGYPEPLSTADPLWPTGRFHSTAPSASESAPRGQQQAPGHFTADPLWPSPDSPVDGCQRVRVDAAGLPDNTRASAWAADGRRPSLSREPEGEADVPVTAVTAPHCPIGPAQAPRPSDSYAAQLGLPRGGGGGGGSNSDGGRERAFSAAAPFLNAADVSASVTWSASALSAAWLATAADMEALEDFPAWGVLCDSDMAEVDRIFDGGSGGGSS
jgi:hypothetical protein